jgi:hypothetical protein
LMQSGKPQTPFQQKKKPVRKRRVSARFEIVDLRNEKMAQYLKCIAISLLFCDTKRKKESFLRL